MKRIGMLTSGGDCQALNAAMRGVAKTLYHAEEKVEIYGFLDGYQGLIYGKFRLLTYDDFSGILTKGGTFLGSSRTPFKTIQEPGADGVDKVAAMKQTYYKLQLDCLVILGGNGTHKTANLLRTEGLNVITLPKTIDNDTPITEFSVGFNSAVQVCMDAVDSLNLTARSHHRALILEVMGRDAGHLAMHAALAGMADVCLVPEIPYKIDSIINKLKAVKASGRNHAVIVVSEGIKNENGEHLIGAQNLIGEKVYGGIGDYLSAEINKRYKEFQTRVTRLGHVQRAGAPTAFDRTLAAVFGAKAVELLDKGETNRMVIWKGGKVSSAAIEEVIKEGTTLLNPDSDYVKAAVATGMYVGEVK